MIFEQVGSRVFLPNLPSVCALLYKIKHVVEITPITFPKGIPDDFHPDTHGFKLTPTGEFIVEVLKQDSGQTTLSFNYEIDYFRIQGPPAESLSSVAERAEWMKLTEKDINRLANSNFPLQW